MGAPVGKAKSSSETKETERIVHFERVCAVEHDMEQELRFQVTKAGENKLVLHALCDSYAGLDKRMELAFTALDDTQHARQYKVHPVDEGLDSSPTIFQQFLGELNRDEEEESDEEHANQEHANHHERPRAASGDSSDGCDSG